MNDEERLWLLRNNNIDAFPRYIKRFDKFGFVFATVMHNEDEFRSFLNDNGKYDKSVAIYSIWQVKNNLYDTVFFDIDAHLRHLSTIDRLERAYVKLKSVREILMNLGIDFSRVYVTGRGFHAFVDFDLTSFDNFSNVYVRLASEYSITNYIDMSVVKNKFFGRFVGTRNSKARAGIVVRRIDFTKPTFREAMRSSVDWAKYNDIIGILKSL